MKFTLGWLHDHLQTDAPLELILERLTMIGLEVEDCVDPRVTLAPFVIAKVVDCTPHPDADRLRVCQVDYGVDETTQVVCGAPNARSGMVGVFVPPGNTVPGTGVALKAGKIRGQESNGMLCSGRELMVSDEHDGIIDLPEDAPVGTSFADYWGLNDPVIEIGLTPNRGDAASVRGIARDLAASGLGTLKPLDIPFLPSADDNAPAALQWRIDNNAFTACPQVKGRTFAISENPAAPEWMQKRLLAIGLRPISALVDITNYVTCDIGRPLHIFDADRLNGNHLTMQHAQGGESFLALNGNSYTVEQDDLIICDHAGMVSLAGIIGGEDSSVHADTRRVFLECASFNASTVSRTGRRMAIDSDARFRFERHVDLQSLDIGIAYASHLIAQCCGDVQASPICQAGSASTTPEEITLPIDHLNRYAGIAIAASTAQSLLENIGCTVRNADTELGVTPPSYRPDIVSPVCLVEEVLRLHGYDNVPAESLPSVNQNNQPLIAPAQRRQSLMRRILAQRGLSEVINLSFCGDALAESFGNGQKPVTITNPINAEMALMRPTPLTGLMRSAIDNFDHYRMPLALFQIGPGWVRNESSDQQIEYATGLRLGADLHWHSKITGGNDPFAVKADVLALLSLCGIDQPGLKAEVPRHYHPHRSGTFYLGNRPVAYFGNLHPDVIQRCGLKLGKDTRIACFEVILGNLPPARNKTAIRPRFVRQGLQPLSRDLSFIVPKNFAAGNLVRLIQTADKKMITTVTLFDEYQNDNIRAVAYRIFLQPTHNSLTEDEIQAVCDKIISTVLAKSPAKLRD